MREDKGGSEISEIRVRPGSRSHGFTLSPTMAAGSYMQEDTFDMGGGRVKGRGTLPTAPGEWTTGRLGPFLIIGIFQILVLNLLFTLTGKKVSGKTRFKTQKADWKL